MIADEDFFWGGGEFASCCGFWLEVLQRLGIVQCMRREKWARNWFFRIRIHWDMYANCLGNCTKSWSFRPLECFGMDIFFLGWLLRIVWHNILFNNKFNDKTRKNGFDANIFLVKSLESRRYNTLFNNEFSNSVHLLK